jgi:hypothetical protein
MADSTLNAIQQKVRRLTRSPSENQLTTAQLNQYINTFVLYDFPEQIRLLNLRTTFTFYTEPYVDVYPTSTDPNSPLYNFINKYISVHPPIYIAGFQSQFFEDREQFFGIYPFVNSIASIGVAGDGTTATFSGVVNSQQAINPPGSTQQTAILRNNVLFSSVSTNYFGLSLIDYPISPSLGNLYLPGDISSLTSMTVQDPVNYINYVTGQFVITFPFAPGKGEAINSQTVPQNVTLPQALLFYDGEFTVRPVPDQPYAVNMEVYVQPTELLTTGQSPDLQEWWQYIAYGAAKKVFEDRMDLDSVQQIMPEFKMQERLCLRRSIVQQTSQRSSTIYTENIAGGYGAGWFSGGGQF